MVAGQAGLTGHLRIGRRARIGAQAGVMADVPAGADVVGSPAQPVREFFRHVACCGGSARGVWQAVEGQGFGDGDRYGLSVMDSPATEMVSHDDAIEVVDIARIMHAIPHRYPFLMIDRVVDVVRNQSAIGIKNVSVNESFFAGALPQPSGDARRADHRKHGADRGGAGG